MVYDSRRNLELEIYLSAVIPLVNSPGAEWLGAQWLEAERKFGPNQLKAESWRLKGFKDQDPECKKLEELRGSGIQDKRIRMQD